MSSVVLCLYSYAQRISLSFTFVPCEIIAEGVSANCRSPAAAIRLSKTALFGGFVFLLVTMFS